MRLQDHMEIELKLTVLGDNPDSVLDAVAALERIGNARLGPPVEHRLLDVYWDLPDLSMRSGHLSLRLRRIDDALVFTVKGGTSSSEGLFQRYELEIPATAENWRQIRDILAQEGAQIGPVSVEGEPTDWLAAAGLVVTQHRATHRTARDVLGDEQRNGIGRVAELALDRTEFRFGETRVKYWEIEIEQVDPSGSLPELGLALMDRFPRQLALSEIGKYSRGLSIERQLRAAGRL